MFLHHWLRHPAFWFWLLVTLVAGLSAAFMLHHISSPGIYSDETMYIPAALGMPDPFLPARTFAGFRIWILDYVGMLHAWVLAPGFRWLGVSVATLRIPSVLVFVGSIFFLAHLFRKIFGSVFTLAVLTLFALNPTLLAFTRTDSVPYALTAPFKGLLIYAIWRFHESGNLGRYLAYAAIATFLGIFHRLDFFLVTGGLLVAAFWLNHKSSEKRQQLLFIGGFALAILGSMIFMSAEHVSSQEIGPGSGIFDRLRLFTRAVVGLVDGTLFLWGSLGGVEPKFYFYPWAMLALVLWPLTELRKKAPVPEARTGWFALIALTVMLIGMFFVKRVEQSWHFLGLSLLWELAAASGICVLAHQLTRRYSAKVGRITLGLFFLIAVRHLLPLNAHFHEAYDGKHGPVNLYWSKRIYDLINFRKQHEKDFFLLFEWGSYMPVAGLSHNYQRTFPFPDNPLTLALISDRFNQARDQEAALYVVLPDYYPAASLIPVPAIQQFEEMMKAEQVYATLAQQYFDENRSVYRVYRVDRISQR